MTVRGVCGAFFVAVALSCGAAVDRPVVFQPWWVAPPVPLRSGDLIARRRHALWTRVMLGASREGRFSHVGMVAETVPEVMILHTEANDVTGAGCAKLEPWTSFCTNSDACAIFRYEKDARVASAMATNAVARLGVPFDAAFDLSETNRLYCSELLRIAINEAVKTNLVGTSVHLRKRYVAIDDLYGTDFTRVWDSEGPKADRDDARRGGRNRRRWRGSW